MNVSVASVTVSYNSVSKLDLQIGALLRQSVCLQEIIVVDNASTDGTIDLLSRHYPQVTVLRMAKNLGMGGALAAGLKYAVLEMHHDWVWTFDGDSEPNDNALEVLLKATQSFGNMDGEVGILAALPIHRGTGICYPPLFWRDGFVRPTAEQLRQPIWFADLVISSGCLVRRDVVENVGLPRSDFFIDFVDFEYCLRTRSHGYNIAVVTGAEVTHEIGEAREVRLLGYYRLWPDHTPLREYYMSRNLTYAVWWLYPTPRSKTFVLRHLSRHAGGLLLFGTNKIAGIKKIAQGFRDGRRASLGIRFLPN